MSENRKISIALPTYNRDQLTIDSFAQVLNDDRVVEVVIADDCSTDDSFQRLCEFFKDEPKVELFTSGINNDCYRNKHRSVQLSTGERVILLDSDNKLTAAYLDAIYAIPEWDEKTIYQPEFAQPHFDFRKFSGLTITKENVAQYADTNLMTSLNAMNFFINREEYLKVWDGSVDPGSSDSIYFSLCWLKAGNSIRITPNLHYYHHIHTDKSNHYNQNAHKYVEFHKRVMDEIRNLK